MVAEAPAAYLRIVDEKYGLLRELGRGGMGAVYEAVHLRTKGRVAIKFLHHDVGEDSEAVRRFQREAQAAAGVGHDAIIAVHDIGVEPDGTHYLVMESLEGASLGELLGGEGRLEVPLAAHIGCQVLSGLAAAHETGIVHRDLKPENIFLVDAGLPLPKVKILDFGISRAVGDHAGAETRLTRTGTVLGTPDYMAPEHARGQSDLDQRADLYATGVILYECLTGTVPHVGENYNAVLARILTEEPAPPTLHRPDLPPALEAVVLRALEKDRANRYQDAAEMFEALLPFVEPGARQTIPAPRGVVASSAPLESEPAPLPASATSDTVPAAEVVEPLDTMAERPRSRRGLVIALLALLALVISGVVIGAFVVLRGAADGVEPPTTVVTSPVAAVPLPAEVAAATGPAPSPDQETVTIRLSDLPEGAEVFLDDALAPDLPLRLRKNGPTAQIRVEAAGFEPFRVAINPSRDQDIHVELRRPPAEKVTTPLDTRPSKGRPGRGKRPRPSGGGSGDGPSPHYTPPYLPD